jgi:hypothetical protein
MNGTSEKSKRRTCAATPSVTGSLALADGPLPCDSPAGPTTDLFGRAVAPASPSRQRAPVLGATIRATFGRPGFASSASADLTRCLVSRLKQRLPTGGSTLFAMTWREKATPRGRSVSRLAVSARRTSDSDCGGWRTPDVPNKRGGGQDPEMRLRGGHAVNLQDQVTLTGWTTPQAHDVTGRSKGQKDIHGTKHGCACLVRDAELAGWPSPCTPSGGRSMDPEKMSATGMTLDGRKHTVSLEHAVKFTGWATASARDWKDGRASQATMDRNARPLNEQATMLTSGPTPPGSPAETGKRGQLNPRFSLWLMGYPTAWACCGERVTRLSRKSRPSSSKPSWR